MGIQINGQTDTISATDGGFTIDGASGNLIGNLTGTASTATAAATAYGLSGSPTLSGITSVSTTNLTVNGSAYPSTGPLGNRNKIINGNMRIDQRNAGVSINPTNGQYSVDRFKALTSPTGKFSLQQNAGSVTPPAGFKNYLGATSLSAYTVTSTDYFGIIQSVEGYNMSDFDWGTSNAKSVTLSFWVRSSLTGTFGLAFGNENNDRGYAATYTISSSNTWEYKTVTISGPTTGTWNSTTGTGIQIVFGLGIGSNTSATAGSWQNSFVLGATGATSVVGTNGATFYITGVQLEVGSVATPFEHRNYGDELARCQRYYWNTRFESSNTNSEIGIGAQYDGTTGFVSLFPPVSMRTVPSLVVSNSSNYYVAYSNGTNTQFNTFTLDNSTTPNIIGLNASTSRTAGHAILLRNNNIAAQLAFSSEL